MGRGVAAVEGQLAGGAVAAHHEPVVAGDRQHVAGPSGLQFGPQPGTVAVDLIAGHPRRRHPGVQCQADHGRGQLGLGRKANLLGHASRPHTVGIVGPRPGQVQLPVNHRVPGVGGIHQVDRDLGVSTRPAVPVYWRCTPTVRVPFFRSPVSSDDQGRLGVAKAVDHVVADIVADLVLLPYRPGQQVLHPVRVGVAGVLGDRPAVLSWQLGQQPAHQRPCPPAQVHPSEPTRDPAQQLLQQLLPAGRVYLYAVARGHRLIFGCVHSTCQRVVSRLLTAELLIGR